MSDESTASDRLIRRIEWVERDVENRVRRLGWIGSPTAADAMLLGVLIDSRARLASLEAENARLGAREGDEVSNPEKEAMERICIDHGISTQSRLAEDIGDALRAASQRTPAAAPADDGAALAQQAAAGGDVEMPRIIAFLLGEDTFSGYWFGEAPPGEGRYWWRRHLREHFSAAARAGDGGGDSILVRAKETK